MTNYKELLQQIRNMHTSFDKAEAFGMIVENLAKEWNNSAAGSCLPFCQYAGISEEEYGRILNNDYDRLPDPVMEKLEKITSAADYWNAKNDRSDLLHETESLADTARHINAQLSAYWLLIDNADSIDTLSRETVGDLITGMQQQLAGLADRLDQIKI